MRVIEEEALRKHVADFPDLIQKERAAHFKVSASCIGYGLRKLGITRKKTLGYKQRCDEQRATYQQERTLKEVDGKSAIYLDECGFCDESFRSYYAYAPPLFPGSYGKKPLSNMTTCDVSKSGHSTFSSHVLKVSVSQAPSKSIGQVKHPWMFAAMNVVRLYRLPEILSDMPTPLST